MTTEMFEKPEIIADSYLKAILSTTFSKFGFKAGSEGWHSIKNWDSAPISGKRPMFIACMLENIDTHIVKALQKFKTPDKFYLVFKGHMPSRAVADRMAMLSVRDDRRILYVETELEKAIKIYLQRFLLALDCQQDETHILDAWWEQDIFVVVSPTVDGFTKLRVPLDKLPVLKQHSGTLRANFEIDSEGLYIYWPQLDVHLGWEQFEQAVDVHACLKNKQKTEEFNQQYGEAIRQFRQKQGLRQSDISGLTPRQIARIEKGQCRATHAALAKLAKAHNSNVGDYMNEIAKLLE
jgi:hypothetical protein